MTVTINLPESVEKAYEAAALSQGVSVNSLLTEVLVSHTPNVETVKHPELTEENGIPVLRTGQALALAAVNDTLETVRRERDLSVLG